jgi:hypothetical protein
MNGRRRGVLVAASALVAGTVTALVPAIAGAKPDLAVGAVGTPDGFAAVAAWDQNGTTAGDVPSIVMAGAGPRTTL